MNQFIKWLHGTGNLSRAFNWALTVGCLMILAALLIHKTGNPNVHSFGSFLSGLGNDIFLIGTNLLIIIWAWRLRLRSLIVLVLGMDLAVWAIVQGVKLLKITPWYLRPNGGTGGFPSGHTTHAFAMAFLLTLFFPRFAWLWYTCAAAISWSRIETDWHTGFQVAAGVIFGLAIAWALTSQWLKHPEARIIQSVQEERQSSASEQALVTEQA